MADINPFTGKPYKTSTTQKNELEEVKQKILYGTRSGNWGGQTKSSNPFITNEPDPYSNMDMEEFKNMIVTDVRKQDPIKPTQDNSLKKTGKVDTEPIINMNRNGIRKSILDRPPLIPEKSETAIVQPTEPKSLKTDYKSYKEKVESAREGAPVDLQKNKFVKGLYDNVLDPVGFAAEKLYETPVGRTAITAGNAIHGEGAMTDYDGEPMVRPDGGGLSNFVSDSAGYLMALGQLKNGRGTSLLKATDKVGERAGKALYDMLPQGTNATQNIINTIVSDMGRGAVDNATGNAILALAQGADFQELIEQTGMGAIFGGVMGGAFSGVKNAPEFIRNKMAPDIPLRDPNAKLIPDGDVTSASTSHTPPTPEPGPIVPDTPTVIKDMDIDIKGNVDPNRRVIQQGGSYIDINETPLPNGDLKVDYTEHRPVVRTKMTSKGRNKAQEPIEDVGQANTPVEEKEPMVDEYGPSVKGFSVEDSINYANDIKSGKVDAKVKLNDFGGNDQQAQFILNNGNRADLMELFNEHAQSYYTLKEQGGDKNIMSANKMRAKEVLQAMEIRGMELPENIPADFTGDFITRISSKDDMSKSVVDFLENKIKELDANPGVKATQMEAYNGYVEQLDKLKNGAAEVEPEITAEPEVKAEPKYTTQTFEIPKPNKEHHGMVDRSTEVKADKPSILEPPPLKPETKVETETEAKPFKEPEETIRKEVSDAFKPAEKGPGAPTDEEYMKEWNETHTVGKVGDTVNHKILGNIEIVSIDGDKVGYKRSKSDETSFSDTNYVFRNSLMNEGKAPLTPPPINAKEEEKEKSVVPAEDIKAGKHLRVKPFENSRYSNTLKVKSVKEDGTIIFDTTGSGFKDQADFNDYYFGQHGVKAPKVGDARIISVLSGEEEQQHKADTIEEEIKTLQVEADRLFRQNKTDKAKAVKEEIKKKQKELNKLEKFKSKVTFKLKGVKEASSGDYFEVDVNWNGENYSVAIPSYVDKEDLEKGKSRMTLYLELKEPAANGASAVYVSEWPKAIENIKPQLIDLVMKEDYSIAGKRKKREDLNVLKPDEEYVLQGEERKEKQSQIDKMEKENERLRNEVQIINDRLERADEGQAKELLKFKEEYNETIYRNNKLTEAFKNQLAKKKKKAEPVKEEPKPEPKVTEPPEIKKTKPKKEKEQPKYGKEGTKLFKKWAANEAVYIDLTKTEDPRVKDYTAFFEYWYNQGITGRKNVWEYPNIEEFFPAHLEDVFMNAGKADALKGAKPIDIPKEKIQDNSAPPITRPVKPKEEEKKDLHKFKTGDNVNVLLGPHHVNSGLKQYEKHSGNADEYWYFKAIVEDVKTNKIKVYGEWYDIYKAYPASINLSEIIKKPGDTNYKFVERQFDKWESKTGVAITKDLTPPPVTEPKVETKVEETETGVFNSKADIKFPSQQQYQELERLKAKFKAENELEKKKELQEQVKKARAELFKDTFQSSQLKEGEYVVAQSSLKNVYVVRKVDTKGGCTFLECVVGDPHSWAAVWTSRTNGELLRWYKIKNPETKQETPEEKEKDLTPPPINKWYSLKDKYLEIPDINKLSFKPEDEETVKSIILQLETDIDTYKRFKERNSSDRPRTLQQQLVYYRKLLNEITKPKEETSGKNENILEQKGGVDNDNVGRESSKPTEERHEPIQLSQSDRETSTVSEGDGGQSGPDARLPISGDEGKTTTGQGPSSDGRNIESMAHTEHDTGDSGKRAPRSAPRKRDNNFVITKDTVIFEPGNKTKLKNNIDAIKTMIEIEKSGKPATKAQKETLIKYVGWGGLSDVFNVRYQRGEWIYVGDYEKEYKELKELLTKEEFEDARSSSTTAFYTPTDVITGMYGLLDHLGFKGGRILDPSTGTGHFQGLLPKNMRENSKFLAIEKDSVSGRISRLLYPDSDIRISGFEEVDLPNNYFDLAISNVPFGNFGVNDSNYGSYVTERIHDYFFIKALDKVRPGGAVAFITATSTMDNQKSEVRKLISTMADLITAVRVDNTTFSKNAGTSTAADILIFRKKIPGEIGPLNTNFVETQKINLDFGTYFINEYFKENPKNVLGTFAKANWSSLTVEPNKNNPVNFSVWLHKNLNNFPKDLISPVKGEVIELTPEDEIKKLNELKDGSYFIDNGEVYQKKGKAKIKVEGTKTKKIKALIQIKDAVKEVITTQRQDKPDSEVKKAQEKLNKVYDSFVNQYGAISDTKNSNVLKDDPENYILQSLEPEYDKKTKKVKKAHIFTEIELRPRKPITRADNVEEALTYSLNEKGSIDLEYISKLVNSDKKAVAEELTKLNLIYEDPQNGWQSKEIYLSGDVREKLVEAERAVKIDKSFERNVKALKDIIPEDIPFNEIDVKLGASWIPKKVYEDFMRQTFRSGNNTPSVSYNGQTGTWILSKKYLQYIQTFEFKEKFGTKDVYASVILENTMNMKKTIVTYKDEEGKPIISKDATLLAQEKSELIKEEFQTWLYKDADRVEELTRIYNDKFNSIVEPTYTGKVREFPGMNKKYTLRQHQIAVADRVIQTGNTLIAHGVGTGKTLVQIATAMEWRRLGICKKPMWVVPKNRLGQSQSDFLDAYPNAKILVASEVDFSPKEIKALFARITTGDWDCVIIPHSSLARIPVSRETEQAFIQSEMAEIEEAILSAREDGEKNIVKDLVKTLATLKDNLESLLDAKRFDVSTIEEMGIDGIIVDESHEFRNVGTYTKFTRIKGIKTTPVKKAKDLMMKVRYISGLHGGNAGVVFATGTPIVNSLNEVYNTFKYLRPDILKKLDIKSFDSFMSIFGAIENEVEVTADGRWKPMDRFRKFTNAAELMSLFKIFTDIKLDASELNLGLPDVKGGAPEMVKLEPHPEFDVFVDELVRRAEALEHRKGKPEKGEDNHLSIFNDSKKATTDLRLIDNTLPDYEGSKINVCVKNVYEIYKESTDRKATQLIFLDRGRSTKDGVLQWDAYADLKAKLIEKGIPENEIAFPVTYTTKEKKQSLFEEVNKGAVRILIGSYDAMGTGLNVQERLYAIHELDTPYNPATIEQAEGRMVRQKNKHYEWKIPVRILRYAVSGTGSYDTMGWQILESKVKGQKKFYKGELRNFDIDSEDDDLKNIQMIKAISTGDERVVRKIKVDQEVSRLKSLKRNFLYTLSNTTNEIDRTERSISFNGRKLIQVTRDLNIVKGTEPFSITVNGKTYAEKEEAGTALREALRGYQFRNNIVESTTIGTYRGLTIAVVPSPAKAPRYVLKNNYEYEFVSPADLTTGLGVIQRLDRTINNMAEIKKNTDEDIKISKENLEKYKKASTETTFKYEDELNNLLKEQVELNTALGQIKKDDIVEVEEFTEEPTEEPKVNEEDETAAGLTIDLKLNSGEDFESINERLKNIIFKGYEPHTITKIIKRAPLSPPPPGKKQKVSKFKKNTWRTAEMFNEPEMQALIDDLDAFYQYKPTVETFSRAIGMLEEDFEGTMDKVLTTKEELTAEDVTASAIITANLMEQGKRDKDYTQAALFINRLRPRITNLGQALQAVSNFKKLTAEGVVMKASKEISDYEKELVENVPEVLNEANGAVDAVADAMEEINDESVDDVVESVEDILDSVYENYGTDNSESDNYVSEIFDSIEEADADSTVPGETTPQSTPGDLTPPEPGKGKGKGKGTVTKQTGKGSGGGKGMPQNPDEDPLEVILARKINKYSFAPQKRLTMEAKLLRTLFNIAKDSIDPKYPKGPIDPDVFIKSAVLNRELYEDVWDQAKGILQDTYKGDQEAIDILNAYFEQKLVPVYLERDLTRSIKNKLKEQGINLNQLVREHYTKLEKVGEDIKNTFRAKGFTEAEMNYLTDFIELEFERITNDKKEKILAQMFKPKSIRKKFEGTAIKKIIELSNLGAYNDDRYKNLIYEQLGLPVLTPTDVEFIDTKMAEYDAETDERKKELIFGQIKRMVAEKRVGTKREKIKGIMRISMLLNGKTIISRNIPGNAVLLGTENIKSIPGTPIDKAIDLILGTGRTTTIAGPKVLKAQLAGIKKGVKEHLEDAKNKSDTSHSIRKYDIPMASPFKNKVLKYLDNMVGFLLGAGDRPFFEAGKMGQEEMFRQLNKGEELTDTQKEIAKEVGLFNTYQNDGPPVKMVGAVRTFFNGGKVPETIGPGDTLVPFTKTLGNMFYITLQYNGLGLIQGVASFRKLCKMAGGGGGKPPKPPTGRRASLGAPEPGKRRKTVVTEAEILKQQKKTVDELSRGLVAIILVGAGALLYELGKLTGPLSENQSEREIQKANGIQENSIKFNGKYYSLEFLQPIVPALFLGASLKEWSEDEIGAAEILKNVANGMFKSSVYSTFERIFGYGNFAENLFEALIQTPTMFIPTFFKQIEQTIDPYQRDTYSKNVFKQVLNQIMAKVPILAEELPAKLDIWGNEVLNYDGDNNPLRTMLQPNFTTREKQNVAATLALDVFNNTGDSEVLPKVAPKSMQYTIDGERDTHRLTAGERREYQKAVGSKCLEEFKKLAESKIFMDKSYEEKSKKMASIVKEIHTEMRIKILNDNGIKVK